MEDENGLELSLGLSCGGSSVKSKGKNGVPSDTRAEEVDRGNSFTDDFKNFLHPGTQKHDSSMDSQRSDPVKPHVGWLLIRNSSILLMLARVHLILINIMMD